MEVTQPNVVPDQCEMVIDRRFVVDEDPIQEAEVFKEIAQQVRPERGNSCTLWRNGILFARGFGKSDLSANIAVMHST